MYRYLKTTAEDVYSIVEFYRTYLNDGSNVEKYIMDGINDDKYVGYKCVDEDGNTIGLLSSRSGIDFTYPHEELYDEISAICGERTIFTLDAIAVIPEYRKAGIAQEITRHVMHDIKANGGELALMEMWIHPTGYIPVYKMFDEYGKYIYNKEMPLFYKDLGRYGYTSCPICGESCKCGALIRIMELY